MSGVYPRRNLGLSENWGRVVEGRIETVTTKLGIEIQNLSGLDRYSASSAEQFARNAARIEEALRALPRYFAQATTNAAPSVGTAWATIASISLAVPLDKPTLEVLATASSVLPYPAGSSTTRFSWPFSLDLVTSEYGPRDGGFHEGIDFAGGAASSGSPIPCAGDGVVAVATTGHPGWGNYVRVTHDVDGTAMSTLYAHMISAPIVSAGATVSRGQILGYVGNTGASFGDHLHFETWTSTSFGSHADPRWFIDAYGGTSTSSAPPRLRIVIAGNPSAEFSGALSETIPRDLSYSALHGRSITAPGSVAVVELQAISGAAITGYPTTLAVTGSFHD